MNKVEQEYQIKKLRQKVRSFIYRCTVCKKHSGKHYEYAEHYDLLKARLEPGVAFCNIGIDYCETFMIFNVYNQGTC